MQLVQVPANPKQPAGYSIQYVEDRVGIFTVHIVIYRRHRPVPVSYSFDSYRFQLIDRIYV